MLLRLILLKDKQAGEKLLSVWWIFCMAIVLAGIITGVLLYYNKGVDIRGKEAGILGEKLMNCILDNKGFLKTEVYESNSDKALNVFKFCNLKEDLFKKLNNEPSVFYFKISFFKADKSLLINNIFGGDSSFEKDCEITNNGENAKNYPQCVNLEENMLYLDLEDNQIKTGVLKILSASNSEAEIYN